MARTKQKLPRLLKGRVMLLKTTQTMLRLDKIRLETFIHASKTFQNSPKTTRCGETFIRRFMGGHGWTDRRCEKFIIATSEALENAVRYGKSQSERSCVRVAILLVNEQFLYVSIGDNGAPINLRTVGSKMPIHRNIADLNDHGRGFSIMSEWADLVAINPADDNTYKEVILGLEKRP